MPGVRVEDNDVEAVYLAASEAVARARAGDGPSLIEVHTLRLWGHFEGDAQGYRPELAEVVGHDPIPSYETKLRSDGILDDSRRDKIYQQAGERIEQAIAFAKSSPLPDPSTARSYIFA
jgi:pyruvate dehydrogenase E1 component alpha subunit